MTTTLCVATNGVLVCHLPMGHAGSHAGDRGALFTATLASGTAAFRCARALMQLASKRSGTWREIAPELWLQVDGGEPTAMLDASAERRTHAVCQAYLHAHYRNAHVDAWWQAHALGWIATVNLGELR